MLGSRNKFLLYLDIHGSTVSRAACLAEIAGKNFNSRLSIPMRPTRTIRIAFGSYARFFVQSQIVLYRSRGVGRACRGDIGSQDQRRRKRGSARSGVLLAHGGGKVIKRERVRSKNNGG